MSSLQSFCIEGLWRGVFSLWKTGQLDKYWDFPVSNNAPTLETVDSTSTDLFFVIFGNEHTFENVVHIQKKSLQFWLLCLLLNSFEGNDAKRKMFSR